MENRKKIKNKKNHTSEDVVLGGSGGAQTKRVLKMVVESGEGKGFGGCG